MHLPVRMEHEIQRTIHGGKFLAGAEEDQEDR